ncbi:hypothetical protein LT493_05355 [Streptomyces tricolor]|nr:hypothetical protein [Streptomyces tricolor]
MPHVIGTQRRDRAEDAPAHRGRLPAAPDRHRPRLADRVRRGPQGRPAHLPVPPRPALGRTPPSRRPSAPPRPARAVTPPTRSGSWSGTRTLPAVAATLGVADETSVAAVVPALAAWHEQRQTQRRRRRLASPASPGSRWPPPPPRRSAATGWPSSRRPTTRGPRPS